MDVDNVTEQYAQLIDRQKQTLLEAKRRQGQRPRDRKSREETYNKFMIAFMFRGNKRQKDMVHSSFIPPAYIPCNTPMTQLRRVAIKDLQLETHHRGTYLPLRSITPPNLMTAIMAIMEDENGDTVMLQLYQQEDEDTRAAADIVDVGTLLLVKEPYFKVMGDGEYGLRVDHLSDVIHLERDDARTPEAWQPRLIEIERSAELLKIKGNLAMNEGRHWDAITEYSDALSQPATANQIEIIKRNRSLAFLKTKQFDAALSDTGFPNFNPNPAEKAMFRAAEALYNLEQFSECCQVLELLRANFPHNSQASAVLGRAQSRCLEQKTGSYNFKELQAKAGKLRPPHLDHATYIGPVEIRHTESKGRGLFVTKAVKAGDLLLCEKAFGHVHVDEGAGNKDESSSKITLLINPETNQGFMGAQADLIKLIVQKLYRNPSVAPALTTLYHGTYEGVCTSAVDAKPIVDTFLVERIISFNVFGCPVSSLAFRTKAPIPATKTREQKAHHSCGIWVHASYINHSCTSNARRAFIGNMMIVRASRDMEAGTEITFWYHSPDGTSAKDFQEKLRHWGFVCRCAICLDARATDPVIVMKRRKLVGDLEQVLNLPALHRVQMKKIERLLDILDRTYTQPAEDVPRLLIWAPQLALAHIYAAQDKAGKSIELVGKVLTSLGFAFVGTDSSHTRFAIIRWGLLVDSLVETFLCARTAFAEMGAREDSRRAEEYARTTYKIIVGEDTSFNAT
ncbi:MAG: hypothetical protein M1840_005847 [Geoglossum simile]|nr:MAG: hypothetical protein M1840_005847 [Geoglossum simile]